MHTNILFPILLYRAFLQKEINTVQKCSRLLSPLNDVQFYFTYSITFVLKIFKEMNTKYFMQHAFTFSKQFVNILDLT